MRFPRAAGAARAGQSGLRRIFAATAIVIILLLAGLSLSCGSNSSLSLTGPDHNAYITLPKNGSVALLHIEGATGVITIGYETPQVVGTTPTGLALLPSKKFLYVVNSDAISNSISIFNVAPDGVLTLSSTPTPVGGSGPDAAVIDPSGSYLLVTNNFTNNVSVFSIDPGSGALSMVGLPVPANSDPSEILFTHSGKFVYVTNPSIGMVSAFSFCPPQQASEPQCSAANGILSPVSGSPFPSGLGAYGLAVDAGDQFLYVANPSASNPPPYSTTIGNISGFSIDPGTGALTTILGSPFTATNGSGPTAITVDPSGTFVYAVTTGSSFSIWCFTINPTNGQLVAVTSSPFSLTAGALFALIDPSGNYFYIGSQLGNGIAGYTYNPSTGVPTAIAGSPFSTATAPGKMVLSE
jgi:6-phosphogluconolactonase